MIRIRRPNAIPNVLQAKGRQRRDEHVAAHARGENIVFDRDVYTHADVKSTLRAAQHDKCGFCESKVGHVAFGDVEHFRPKAAFRPMHGDPLTRPGYYWLAYEWLNLLFSCEVCNRRNKANLFSLADHAARAKTSAITPNPATRRRLKSGHLSRSGTAPYIRV